MYLNVPYLAPAVIRGHDTLDAARAHDRPAGGGADIEARIPSVGTSGLPCL